MGSTMVVSGHRFFDVDGVPVRIEPLPGGELSVFAFDPAQRLFPLDSVIQKGVEISHETFREMVVGFRERQALRARGTHRLSPDDEEAWDKEAPRREEEEPESTNPRSKARVEED